MAAFLTRAPAVEPVSTGEAKAHLRVDGEDEDGLIARLVTTARRHLEGRTRRAFVDQGWRTTLDGWPADGIVVLRPAPLAAVEAVTVFDGEGTPHVVAAADYTVVAARMPGLVRIAGVASGLAANGLEIDFAAGYGPAATDVPEPLRQAILMLVGHWFEHREAARIGAIAAPVALGVEALAAPYRVARL